jgi:hypothetical protein
MLLLLVMMMVFCRYRLGNWLQRPKLPILPPVDNDDDDIGGGGGGRGGGSGKIDDDDGEFTFTRGAKVLNNRRNAVPPLSSRKKLSGACRIIT